MLANPNKPIDILCATVPQKYFVFIALIFAHFVLPYDWISISAVIIVSSLLHFVLGKRQLINPCVATFERATRVNTMCGQSAIGYITAERGTKNASESTDHHVPFNRRELRGNVGTNPAFVRL